MTHSEIIRHLNEEVSALSGLLGKTDNEIFFRKPGAKWSIAENVQHLVLSARPLNLAFLLPKLTFRVLYGKPCRKSYPYDEIFKRYKQLLADGAVATGAYVPRSVPLKGDKSALMKRFRDTYISLSEKIMQWSEEDLDNYLLPHPLLGRLTVREMLYFTAFHVRHHRETVETLRKE